MKKSHYPVYDRFGYVRAKAATSPKGGLSGRVMPGGTSGAVGQGFQAGMQRFNEQLEDAVPQRSLSSACWRHTETIVGRFRVTAKRCALASPRRPRTYLRQGRDHQSGVIVALVGDLSRTTTRCPHATDIDQVSIARRGLVEGASVGLVSRRATPEKGAVGHLFPVLQPVSETTANAGLRCGPLPVDTLKWTASRGTHGNQRIDCGRLFRHAKNPGA